jgi:hypothetical protein
MTPKEKAENLTWKYLTSRDIDGHNDVRDVHAAIRCALIAVDEILKLDNHNTYNYLTENKKHLIVELANKYWQEVKQEIEAL